MSFAGKLVNIVQTSVLIVVSATTVVTLAAFTIYGGSRAADWALGLPRHRSIQWLGDHAQQIAHGADACANVAIAVGLLDANNR